MRNREGPSRPPALPLPTPCDALSLDAPFFLTLYHLTRTFPGRSLTYLRVVRAAVVRSCLVRCLPARRAYSLSTQMFDCAAQIGGALANTQVETGYAGRQHFST